MHNSHSRPISMLRTSHSPVDLLRFRTRLHMSAFGGKIGHFNGGSHRQFLVCTLGVVRGHLRGLVSQPHHDFPLGAAWVLSGVGAKLLQLSGMRSWVRRDLHRGDLGFLTDFAFFRNRRPPSAVVDRLCERGFMAKTERARSRMTLKGWVAILLRRTFARSGIHMLSQAEKTARRRSF